MRSLKTIANENAEYIKELKNSKILSKSELARQFSNSICIGYFKEVQKANQMLDVEKSVIFNDAGQN